MSGTQREKDLARAMGHSNPQAYILAQDHRSNSMEQATLPPLDGYSIRAEPWRGDDISGLARRILTLHGQGYDLGTVWYVHITKRESTDMVDVVVSAEKGSYGAEDCYRGKFGRGDALPILDIVKGLDRYSSEAISKTRAPLQPLQLEALLQTAIRERVQLFITPVRDPKGVLAWADLPCGTSQAPPKPESTSFVNGYGIKAWPQQKTLESPVLLFMKGLEGTVKVECCDHAATPNKLHILVQAPGMTVFQGKMTKGGSFPVADIMKCLGLSDSLVVHKQLQEALQEAYTKKITLELYTPIPETKVVTEEPDKADPLKRKLRLREAADDLGKYEVFWYYTPPGGLTNIHIDYGPEGYVSASREPYSSFWTIRSSAVTAPGRVTAANVEALTDKIWDYSTRPKFSKAVIRGCISRAIEVGRDFEIRLAGTPAKDLVLLHTPRIAAPLPSDPGGSIKERLGAAIAKDKAEPEQVPPVYQKFVDQLRGSGINYYEEAKRLAEATKSPPPDTAITKPSLSSKGVFSMFSKLRYLALIVGVLVGGNVAGRYDVDVAAPFMKIVSGALGGLGNVTTPEVIYEGVLVSYENGLYTFEDKTVLSEIVIEGPVYFGQKVKVYSGNRSYYMKRVVD